MGTDIETTIADLLRRRRYAGCVRIGVAGGSGSGKTTVCRLIADGLRPRVCEVIGLDRFFKPVDLLPRYRSSLHAEPRPDFNRPDSLMAGEMAAHCRAVTGGVVLFDGHFALHYPAMRDLMDVKCYVDAPLEEMLRRRTERNLAAGYGGDRETILAYNRECVVPGYEAYILPTRGFADIVIPNGPEDAGARDALIRALCAAIGAALP